VSKRRDSFINLDRRNGVDSSGWDFHRRRMPLVDAPSNRLGIPLAPRGVTDDATAARIQLPAKRCLMNHLGSQSD
jgi:hypothetical protein